MLDGPVLERLGNPRRVLLAGCGGGYDVLGDIPLALELSMYWFFDARTIAATHLFLDELRATDSIWEVAVRVEAARKAIAIRERTSIPI